MGRRVVATVLMAAFAAVPAHGSSDPANVPWETYLPAMPSGTAVQPHAVPYCRKATVKCIDTEIQRLQKAQTTFGCDHRGVFATTYLELTKQLRRTLRADPRFFQDSRYLYREDALFADVYFNTARDYARGKPIAPAWRIAFDTAKSGDVNAAQDMLLGINAHVQNDMPFVVAALGVRRLDGGSRKPDHDRVNEILDAAYEPVVRAVQARYDPIVGTTNASWTFADDAAGLEMVKEWREQVWRNAERLIAAKSDSERAQITDQIQQYAAGWARMIANPVQMPGYRAQRDVYCRQKLG
ncbi:MAG: DUF5995 family protein [Thermoleophilaceae bacterium]